MVSGAVLNFGLMIGLLLWKPDPDQIAVLFIAAALWGLADALWQTQVNGNKGFRLPCMLAPKGAGFIRLVFPIPICI